MDIEKNGEYKTAGYKNENDNWVRLWNKMKQKDRSNNTKFLKLLMREISLCPNIKNISVLGGEPLLYNGIMEILQPIDDKKITIVSGLGVSHDRFRNIMDKIKDIKNISFSISAETTGPIFEFLRYGSSWKDFSQKVEHLKKLGFPIKFLSTITNLTSFDIVSFYDKFVKKHEISYNPVTDRPFLQPNILDDLSKKILTDSIQDKMDNKFFIKLKQSISQPHNDIERKNLSVFLKEFSTRRKLKLDIFPVHFLKWLELV
jgi:organic radical activating enzyme